jgi:Protein of unknown function (DUF4238)
LRGSRAAGNEKKKHHFVPVAYLKEFANTKGELRVYLKSNPEKTIWASPKNTAFRKYYYSQPTPEGGQDNNSLEDNFSKYESKWPEFVAKIRAGQDASEDLDFFFQFLMLQTSRTPATREMVELVLAEQVMQTARVLDRNGMLPPKPEGFEDILKMSVVTIDPHMSIHAMVSIAEGFAKLIDLLGFAIVRNNTKSDFITCDNPVIWFDPSVPSDEIRPHTISPGGPVLFYFPIARDLAIIGAKEAKQFFSRLGLYEGQQADEAVVQKMNRLVAKFAYQTFYASTDSYRDLLSEYSSISPTVEFLRCPAGKGEITTFHRVFGRRRPPNKWGKK